MKPIKLDKFPVTAPDGTEYRVTIEEIPADHYVEAHAHVQLFIENKPRRIFRFKRIFSEDYYTPSHDVNNPDYVKMANSIITDYFANERWLADYRAKKQAERSEKLRNRTRAAEAFRQWNGKITESESEVSE